MAFEEKSNYKFRTFLKNHADPEVLDKQFLTQLLMINPL